MIGIAVRGPDQIVLIFLEHEMDLKIFRHLWGTSGAWAELFPRFLADGYIGIETSLPPAERCGEMRGLLKAHSLEYIPQIFTQGAGVEEHLESFLKQVGRCAEFGAKLINCHSGRDVWTAAEAEDFYGKALEIEAKVAVTVAHETHRGRVFYSPWTCAPILRKFPDLKLCCDYSHWVCVAERLIDDQADILALCAEHCVHIHARVGYEEGPQVPDPSAPEYLRHLQAHEAWWDQIWSSQQARGLAHSTLTPEFGPPAYLHTLPHTNVPVADLATVCNWQARRQAERFARRGT